MPRGPVFQHNSQSLGASYFRIMAKASLSLTMPSLFVLLLSSFGSGGMWLVHGQKIWCVAKPSSDATTLLNNINYACSEVNCSVLLNECFPCFYPDNLMSHASIAMNLYYQMKKGIGGTCDFKNSALMVVTDPSYGNCTYPFK
ncbi:hypothetical protein MRB53_036089 [Persea americana]|uniref:Uncharacterized protein n=1 Tax=Persea americana TaxID=3435 RepID=A0ACC2K6T5_PERAE|nr:hypothetical protein MRB53_036089 [Persea americana]